ncbi:MAG: carbohydrate-binding protein [Clostridiales bacterium]|jgi:hypothetical protein|nr:carbohydrate-binding protein [Clostridiales bacterium]
MRLTLKIEDHAGNILAQSDGADSVSLVYGSAYRGGDKIVLESDRQEAFLTVRLEDTMPPALVYMGGCRHEMLIPFEEKRVCYSPKSFTGNIHLLTARLAPAQAVQAYKNLAYNPYDCHENKILFPCSRANVETRGESVFASRNAIDGICENRGHGPWPYQSWGINRNPEAEMRIAFGRHVVVDKAVLTTRADFPHDSYWVSGTLEFSDGSRLAFPLTKTEQPQTVTFSPRAAEWVILKKLIKADDESPFPALSQIEIWGVER